jgi:hypothetical protein
VCTLIQPNVATAVLPTVVPDNLEVSTATNMVLQTYDVSLNGDCGDHGSPYVADYAPVGHYYTDLDANFYTPGTHIRHDLRPIPRMHASEILFEVVLHFLKNWKLGWFSMSADM